MTLPNLRDRAVCPACGWTAQQLRDTGLMGCAVCYEAFAPLVAHAVAHLHSGEDPSAPPQAAPAPVPGERDALPWPTRRARRSG